MSQRNGYILPYYIILGMSTSSSSSSSSIKRIMIVDDEKELVALYDEFLNKMGFKVDSFTDPLTALENFKQSQDKYFMVLTDLRMPCLNGVELACKIREINKTVVINLITAFNVDNDIRESKKLQSAKIDKILQKPIKMLELKKEINTLLIAKQ